VNGFVDGDGDGDVGRLVDGDWGRGTINGRVHKTVKMAHARTALPFLEFLPLRPAWACFPYPRWAVISPSSARSTNRFVNSSSGPSGPMISFGDLPFSGSSSIWSGGAFSSPWLLIRFGFGTMAIYTSIWTAPTVPVNEPFSLPSTSPFPSPSPSTKPSNVPIPFPLNEAVQRPHPLPPQRSRPTSPSPSPSTKPFSAVHVPRKRERKRNRKRQRFFM